MLFSFRDLIVFATLFRVRTIFCARTPKERLKVVPAYAFGDRLEDFYLKVRTRNHKSYEDAPETIADPEVKSSICEHILTSAALLQGRPTLKPVRLNKRFSMDRWTLKHSDVVLKKTLREESGGEWQGSFQFPNRKRTVRLDGIRANVSDNAFICVGKEAGDYSDFYISEEYNANLASDDAEPYVAARFVFVLAFDDKMKLTCVAVEPASVLKQELVQVEKSYAQARTSGTILPFGPQTDHERAQICWSVFNSSYFDGAVVAETSAETSCTLEEVLIREYTSIQKEWMIDCRTRIRNKAGKRLWYYVSRGVNRDSFCVHSIDDSRGTENSFFSLVNISSNVVQYMTN